MYVYLCYNLIFMYIFFELTLAQPFITFRKGCAAPGEAQG